MATKCTKPVSREMVLFLDNRVEARERDKVTVTVYPEGTIGFRVKRARREVFYPLDRVYQMAVNAAVNAERKAKK